MADQLNLPDKTLASRFIEETLLPLADRLNRLRVDLIYLVVTRQDLKQLVIAGWGSEQFHYNRALDKVAFDGMVDISLDAADGESVVPAPFGPEDSVDKRTENLRDDVGRTEAGVADMISREAQSSLQLRLAEFITVNAMAPLKTRLDQDWFPAGVVGDLSSQFMSTISGAKPEDIVRLIARFDPANPVNGMSIDLMNPSPPDQLRPQIVGAYGDAFRRRSIAVIADWSSRAGPAAIRQTLAAMHATPPADGPALVKLILKTTGIDLTSELAAQ